MKGVIGFDGECYSLYINDKWHMTSVKFDDCKQEAEQQGFEVQVGEMVNGHPQTQPILVHKTNK